MGSSRLNFFSAADQVESSQIIPVDNNHLSACSITPVITPSATRLVFAILELVEQQGDQIVSQIPLASGYISGSSILSWTGHARLGNNMSVRARTYGFAIVEFTLTTLTE